MEVRQLRESIKYNWQLPEQSKTLFLSQFQADATQYPKLAAALEARFAQGRILDKRTNTYIFYEAGKSYNDALPTAYFNHPNIYSMPDFATVLHKINERPGDTEFIFRSDEVHFLIIRLIVYNYDTSVYTPKKRELSFDFVVYIIPSIRLLNEPSLEKFYYTMVYVADRRESAFTVRFFSVPYKVYMLKTSSLPSSRTMESMINRGIAWIQARLR